MSLLRELWAFMKVRKKFWLPLRRKNLSALVKRSLVEQSIASRGHCRGSLHFLIFPKAATENVVEIDVGIGAFIRSLE